MRWYHFWMIWLSYVPGAVFGPDMITGAQHQHLNSAAAIGWIFSAIATAMVVTGRRRGIHAKVTTKPHRRRGSRRSREASAIPTTPSLLRSSAGVSMSSGGQHRRGGEAKVGSNRLRMGCANVADVPSRSQTTRQTAPLALDAERGTSSSCTSVACSWRSPNRPSMTGGSGVITARPKPASITPPMQRPRGRCALPGPTGPIGRRP
jgi:hypothetical protein